MNKRGPHKNFGLVRPLQTPKKQIQLVKQLLEQLGYSVQAIRYNSKQNPYKS